jgi:hypothetical protein
VATTTTAATLPTTPALAVEDFRSAIRQAQSTLTILLENWQRATVDCTFADVPRDLLEQKNKQLFLLEKKGFDRLLYSIKKCFCGNVPKQPIES